MVESPWDNVFASVAVVVAAVVLLVVENVSSDCVASAVVGSLFTLVFSTFLSSSICARTLL